MKGCVPFDSWPLDLRDHPERDLALAVSGVP